MLKGVIVVGLHSSDREALDEKQAGLEFPDTVLDLAVGPGQGGERVLHLPHSGQEVIRGREAGGDTGGGWGGQLPASGYPGERGRAALGLRQWSVTIEAGVTIPQGGAGAGPGAARSGGGGTVGRVQDKCAFSLLLLRPVNVQKVRPKMFLKDLNVIFSLVSLLQYESTWMFLTGVFARWVCRCPWMCHCQAECSESQHWPIFLTWANLTPGSGHPFLERNSCRSWGS